MAPNFSSQRVHRIVRTWSEPNAPTGESGRVEVQDGRVAKETPGPYHFGAGRIYDLSGEYLVERGQ